MKRATIIVLDGVGIGELPDADKYGDVGSNTLMNIKRETNLSLPNMCRLGLGNIAGDNLFERNANPIGSYGKANEISAGKDTTIGHWEITGLVTEKPFPTYPNGFPNEIINKFEQITGRSVLGNCTASGTQIISDLGDEHVKTGNPIVYTSADSVFQIATHEDVVPIEKLYWMCEQARGILVEEHAVARVIARPFNGTSGAYTRTSNRKDYSIAPHDKTLLDYVSAAGFEVAAVGKIEDIFCNQGITRSVHTHTNEEGIEQTIKYLREDFAGLIFTNLVDYDMLYGHRNDVVGFANALEYFDSRLPELISVMHDDDVLIITADHGCDPTTSSTDHSREFIPILVYGKKLECKDLGIRKTYADIAASVADYLDIHANIAGDSFIRKLI